ncbi:putative lecithin retinol acyltransferase-like isoform 3 [Scophthalmus maximus]|uniref:Putative lecithin retinol acyltransferase-like isoform 2 n=1 Tax=Scophthalmus maximus TaxID=52904 RepID=A0A2U9CGK8_SCOMX|nr:putative lecithin retinol acyltransferase-like isoform 2 [Scophthalmus maximus]AWP15754.1 putative lecithin retinol acyltransferase-like isoform 3 [Scophthalmus maximus]
MRNLISMAVILHVVITAAGLQLNGEEVQFGDMIAYPPVCDGKITLQHFAVYVGDRTFPGKEPEHDIFERLKDTETLSPTCIFSTLNVADKPYVFNYLDGYKENGKEYKKGKEEKMEERIREKYNKCSLYSAVGNNCEHLATYVRYGEKISLQVNLSGEKLCILPKAQQKLVYAKGVAKCQNKDG